MTTATLRDVPVLVTGADGFIGSHLVERLVSEGARVRALALYNSQGTAGWLDSLPPEVRAAVDLRLGDIRDARFVEALCQDVERVWHLAALISIPYSYAAPASYLETNVTGTLNVLEGARRCGCRRFVHTSTSEVYGTPESVPIRETHPLQAQSPYAASKIGADQLVLSFQRSFNLPAVVIRPFNTYGPRQSTRAVLPTVLTQLLEGKSEIELGRLDPRRDLTYVADTVDGLVRAGVAPGVEVEGETIHLGTGEALSVGDLVGLCCQVLGVEAAVKLDPRRLRPERSEVDLLLSDPSRARQRLGWTAAVPLAEGIRRTASWLAANLDRYRIGRLHV